MTGLRRHTQRTVFARRHKNKNFLFLVAIVVAACVTGLILRGGWFGTPLPPCEPLDINAAKEGMVCLTRCKPNPVEIKGDPSETISLAYPVNARENVPYEYGKYRFYFPEERVYLEQADGGASFTKVIDYLQPTAYHERLFRRIIAKLYRAKVLDPSKNILNSGSNIGDNALPWARMLKQLSRSPGKVYAIDPSSSFLNFTVNIANENSISNLCTHASLLGSSDGNGVAKLDNLGVENLGLLHLDVEGHEGEVLLGAIELIKRYRPVVSVYIPNKLMHTLPSKLPTESMLTFST